MTLSNSIVKKSTLSSELEVHLNKHSKVMSSPRKLSLGNALFPSDGAIKIAGMATLTVSQETEVKCKVVKVNEMSTVKRSWTRCIVRGR